MLEFDEENARRLVEVYTTPDVVEQRRATRAILALKPGEHVLDVGSGPGFLADEMAQEVGAEGRVAGVDPSESMLALAKRQTAAAEFQSGPDGALRGRHTLKRDLARVEGFMMTLESAGGGEAPAGPVFLTRP